jgi:hypothetical protein
MLLERDKDVAGKYDHKGLSACRSVLAFQAPTDGLSNSPSLEAVQQLLWLEQMAMSLHKEHEATSIAQHTLCARHHGTRLAH